MLMPIGRRIPIATRLGLLSGIVPASNAAMTEALAFLEGYLLAKNLQFQDVVIESDAQEIIRSLNSPSLSYA